MDRRLSKEFWDDLERQVKEPGGSSVVAVETIDGVFHKDCAPSGKTELIEYKRSEVEYGTKCKKCKRLIWKDELGNVPE